MRLEEVGQGERRPLPATIFLAGGVKAELRTLRCVDAVEANSLPVNFDCVSVNDGGNAQFMSCVEGTVNITPANTPLIAEATRTGFQQISDAINHPKSLRALVKLDEPGLYIWIGYPIWSGGLTSVGVGFDQGVTVGSINQQSAISLTGSEFVQDHEVCVARNVPVGLHMVTLSSSAGAAALGLSYVRTRRSSVKKSFGRTTVTGFDRHKDLSAPMAEHRKGCPTCRARRKEATPRSRKGH